MHLANYAYRVSGSLIDWDQCFHAESTELLDQIRPGLMVPVV